MPGIYVDTSALGRVVLLEPDALAIRAVLARFDPWYASELLKVELRRLGRREAIEARAERTLALVTLSGLTSSVLDQAARLDPVNVRALDAIHLATAINLHAAGEVAAVLTYANAHAVVRESGTPAQTTRFAGILLPSLRRFSFTFPHQLLPDRVAFGLASRHFFAVDADGRAWSAAIPGA